MRDLVNLLVTTLAADTGVQALPQTVAHTATPATGSDYAILVALGLMALAFVVVGWRFLSKRRAERIDALGRELDKPLADGETPALPASTDAVVVPKATDLLAAEREALLARAAEDEARRAREKAERALTTAADDDAQQKLAAAKAREEEAQRRAQGALTRAKDLRAALHKTRDGLVGKLQRAVGGKQIDAALLEEIEGVLFTADIGARTSERLLDVVKTKLTSKELTSSDKIGEVLRAEAERILASVPVKPLVVEGTKPRVVLVLGVNGAGKTTTIGKLAAQLTHEGHKVLLGAGDTFRAAAADQLEVWAQRAGVDVVTGPDGGDPSAVLFDAVKKAKAEGYDVVLCDTAGRLHTKVNLMEELKKVARSIGKACDGAPHEVILVLDATVGQNAIQQAKQFGEAIAAAMGTTGTALTGIVLTKLDGTAKGGVVLGIVDEMKVPVRYIGVGERIEDLRAFVPSEFVGALFGDDVA